MTFLKYFIYILAAALASAVLGGVFAALIATISPDFVKGLFSPPAAASLVRYSTAVGMIWGLAIGTGVMAFCVGMVTLVQIAKIFEGKESRLRRQDLTQS